MKPDNRYRYQISATHQKKLLSTLVNPPAVSFMPLKSSQLGFEVRQH